MLWQGRQAGLVILMGRAMYRARPVGGLVGTSNSSFPSAHAAYSTFYVWLAVTIVVRLRPGMARGALVGKVWILLNVMPMPIASAKRTG